MIWRLLVVLLVGLSVAGCVSRPPADPAVISSAAPPWPAPRDAISYIEAAGLKALPLSKTADARTFQLIITVGGQPVQVPAFIGVDRLRALQAPVHTHEPDGRVWLEGAGSDQVTLAQFFAVWGVRFDGRCLGNACGGVVVRADGTEIGDPGSLVLAKVSQTLEVHAAA